MAGVLADAALYAFTGGEPPGYEELVARYESQVAGSGRDDEVWLNWVARLKVGGAAVGFVQATVDGESADLAWVIGVEWQGRGFATEAAMAMKDWLGRTGVELFSAHVHPDHPASQRVAAAIGLVATGRLDEDGEEVWGSNPSGG